MNERERLRATFTEMVAAVQKKNGGMACCRIPTDEGKGVKACIIYVQGLTAAVTADAVEKVQSTFEERANADRERERNDPGSTLRYPPRKEEEGPAPKGPIRLADVIKRAP
jgi:hypothetical protein